MKRITVSFPKALFYILLFILYSCNSSTETTEENKTHLEVYDASCTEVWLQLKVDRISLPAGGVVRIEGIKEIPVTITTNDTLLFFDSLEVNREYRFKVILQNPGQTLTTNEANAKTLDTTSHNFTWQTFEFGEFGSSVLHDVAIIDENNIWAVGEIYVKDSLGNPDPKRYNAVHWNGTKWELKRIYTYSLCSAIDYAPLKSIWAFSESNIVVTTGGGIWKYNGNTFIADCEVQPLLTGAINKLWGTSSNDLYAVGNGGNIAHWNGSSWTKIESGTKTNINDIWGISKSGVNVVYCPVSSIFNPPQDKKILKITNNKVDSISWKTNRIVYSCWTTNSDYIYAAGEDIFANKYGVWEQMILPATTTNSIRGNGINDIIAVGAFGTIFHYNGANWQVVSIYTEKQNYRVEIKNNIAAICGFCNGKGFVEIGTRN